MSIQVANTIEIRRGATDIDRYWSGQGDITISGNKYTQAPGIVEVKQSVLKSGDQNRKMSVVLRSNENSFYQKYINDIGPVVIVIRWTYRANDAANWAFISHIFEGRVSGYSIANGNITFNVESFLGDIHTSKPMVMSAAINKGFEYLEELAQKGIETGWPN